MKLNKKSQIIAISLKQMKNKILKNAAANMFGKLTFIYRQKKQTKIWRREKRFINNAATATSYQCINFFKISIRNNQTQSRSQRNTHMLRRFRNSNRTKNIKIKLWTSSIHLICKKTKDLILIEQRYWGSAESGETTAYAYNDYDEMTKREINSTCRHLRNLDLPISSISSDPDIQKKIRELGYFYQKPTSGEWILLDQSSSVMQMPNHTFSIEE